LLPASSRRARRALPPRLPLPQAWTGAHRAGLPGSGARSGALAHGGGSVAGRGLRPGRRHPDAARADRTRRTRADAVAAWRAGVCYPRQPDGGRWLGPAQLLALVRALRGRTVAVVGDISADEFVYGRVARVSREAPVLILEYDTSEV